MAEIGNILRELNVPSVWVSVVLLFLAGWEKCAARRIAKRDEQSRRAFELLLRRSDFLHQERGKACMLLLKDIMHAKSFIHHMTTPLQQGEVDHKALLDQANAACRAFHDHSLEYGFLFSKSLDEKMQSAKRKLWELLDEAGPDILEAVKKGENPLRNESVRGVNRRIGKELGPIEIELVAEVRSLLGADLDDEPHSRGIS